MDTDKAAWLTPAAFLCYGYMKPVKTVEEIRRRVNHLRQGGKTVGFVPTMGALHEGHLSLIRIAKERTDIVIVSIFINPEQFAPGEDLEKYPRQLNRDLEICENEGVDAVFTPEEGELYTPEKFLRIEIERLNDHMEGTSRPGFFAGVLLVVNKLFNIVEPDLAVFGQKDIQQFRILERMVLEMNHDIELALGPVRRAGDGLALSSRNAYLSRQERRVAPGLFGSLQFIENQVRAGAQNITPLLDHQKMELEAKGFEIDYLDLFSFDKMAPAGKVKKGDKYILAAAVYLGETRLIDNIIFEL